MKRAVAVLLVVVGAALCLATNSFAAAPETAAGSPLDLAVGSDGSIFVTVSQAGYTTLLKFQPDGELDRNFASDGVLRGLGFGQGKIALQSDGKVLVLSSSHQSGMVSRIDADGTIDPTFDAPTPLAIPDVDSISVQPDGTILIAGSDLSCPRDMGCTGGNSLLLQLLPGGQPDPDFGTNGLVTQDLHSEGTFGFLDHVVQPNGDILAMTSVRVLRYLPDGTLDPAFMPGIDIDPTNRGSGLQLALQNGKIIVGTFISGDLPPADSVISFGLEKFNSDGSPDTSFGSNGRLAIPKSRSAVMQDILPRADGGIEIAGSVRFNCTIDTIDYCVEGGPSLDRVDSSGSPQPGWGTAGAISVNLGAYSGRNTAAAVQPDGKTVLATDLGDYGTSGMVLLRYLDDGAPDPGFGDAGRVTVPGPSDIDPHAWGKCQNRFSDFYVGKNPVRGTSAGDVIAGKKRGDHISGRGGNDLICGHAGADHLSGGKGNDRIYGGVGVDRLNAGPGNDTIRSRDGMRDVVLCGSGHDVAIVDRKDRVRGCERVLRKP